MLNEKFRFQLTKSGDKNYVFLHGIIDEDTTFEDLKAVPGPVVFNFKDITAINSCGTRTWVTFIKEFAQKQIYYEECPPLVVRQMNMVPSFMGGAEPLSVFVPYVCEGCEQEKLVLVQQDKMSQDAAESFPCEFCKKGEMVFDGHPKQYFAFSK